MRKTFLFVLIANLAILTLWGCSDSTTGNGNTNENTFSVLFDSQGGSEVVALNVNKGKAVVEPLPPVKDGYVFKGWYKEPTCNTMWDFKTDIVNANIILYAKWISKAAAIRWGAHVRIKDNASIIARKLSERNLKNARIDYWYAWNRQPGPMKIFSDAVVELRAAGISVQAVLFTKFSQGQPRHFDYKIEHDLAEVEKTAYDDVKLQVEKMKGLIFEYELQNEVAFYADIHKEGTKRLEADDYDTPAGHFHAAVLRGMYRAIDDFRKATSLPIRVILGTNDRRYGFLKFMEQQGVHYDIIGYHIYPWEKQKEIDVDPWFGEGGALGQLAKFNKPIHINEFNSGEIYSGVPGQDPQKYENKEGMPVTEKGFRSIYKHLTAIVNQKLANVETVLFYEIVDEPHKKFPENNFGLYYDEKLEHPKISLLLATAFAGGYLSEKEKEALASRGFTFYNDAKK